MTGLSTLPSWTIGDGDGSTASKARMGKTPTGLHAQVGGTARKETHVKQSTSEKTALTHTNAPDLAASMLAGLGKVGYVAQLQNDAGKENAVLVRIVGMRLCDRKHLYAVPGPCPYCATSGTGGETTDV